MNVSLAANAEFMNELKRTDRQRYNRLIDNIQKGAYRLEAATASICQYSLCRASTAHLRARTLFCGAACKMKAMRQAKAA
jgi:uncharacterized protein YbgA (DUF1722 family)